MMELIELARIGVNLTWDGRSLPRQKSYDWVAINLDCIHAFDRSGIGYQEFRQLKSAGWDL
jgi:hypothetical protein